MLEIWAVISYAIGGKYIFCSVKSFLEVEPHNEICISKDICHSHFSVNFSKRLLFVRTSFKMERGSLQQFLYWYKSL